MNATEAGRLFDVEVSPDLAALVDDACAIVAAYEQAMATMYPPPTAITSDRTDEV